MVGTTQNAGVENAVRSDAGVGNAGVKYVARYGKDGKCGSGVVWKAANVLINKLVSAK